MKKKTGIFRVVAINIGVIVAVNCLAQEATTTEWSGSLKRKGKQKESITLNVRITDEGPFITEMIYAGTSFKFRDQKFSGDTLTFSWMPGNKDVECSLKMKDGEKYTGKCMPSDSNNTIEMRIKPDRKTDDLSASEDQPEGQREGQSKDKDKGKDSGKGKDQGKGEKPEQKE